MKYHLITIGKIKEKYLTAGIDEFLKRLRPYGEVTVTVLPEEKMPDNPSPAQKAQVLDKEGEKMLRHVHEGSHLMALDVGGKLVSSEELAASFSDLASTAAVKSPSSLADPSASATSFAEKPINASPLAALP